MSNLFLLAPKLIKSAQIPSAPALPRPSHRDNKGKITTPTAPAAPPASGTVPKVAPLPEPSFKVITDPKKREDNPFWVTALNTLGEKLPWKQALGYLANNPYTKGFTPANPTHALYGGLALGGLGLLGGSLIGKLRNMMRADDQEAKHNDPLFYGALGALGLGLPVMLAPQLLKNLPLKNFNMKDLNDIFVNKSLPFSSLERMSQPPGAPQQ